MNKIKILILVCIFIPFPAFADFTFTVPTDGTYTEAVAAVSDKTGIVTIDIVGADFTMAATDMSSWVADSVVIKSSGGTTALANATITAKATIPIEIYGITFAASALTISGVPIDFKIHGNVFTEEILIKSTNQTGDIRHPYGVLYNNSLRRVVVQGNVPSSNYDYVNGIWNQTPEFGDASTDSNPGVVYIEGNTYDLLSGTGGNVTDSSWGGRYVARYNTVNANDVGGYNFQAHSILPLSSTPMRSGHTWEIYNNIINNLQTSTSFASLRGGTGFFFNNKDDGAGFSYWIVLDNMRSNNVAYNYPGGLCDGSSTFDENLTIDGSKAAIASFYGDTVFSGTHTGSNNSASLVDSGRTWTANVFAFTENAGATVYNTTVGKESSCKITGNDGTTITCTLSDGQDWDTGDTYRISDGWPCRDQIGRGYDSVAWDSTDPLLYNSPQISIPAYFWNNVKDGAIFNTVTIVNDSNAHIVTNRDYYTMQGADCTAGAACNSGVGSGSAKPTTCVTGTAFWDTDESALYKCTATDTWTLCYTPETCPHPLTGLTGSCTDTAGINGYNVGLTYWGVTPSSGTGYSASPSGVQTIDDGETAYFDITRTYGYSISASGCGGSLGAESGMVSRYTTDAITGDCNVTVTATAHLATMATGLNNVTLGAGLNNVTLGN